MWKIFFNYPDGGKITVTGKGTIGLNDAMHYYNEYGVHFDTATVQQYPKKYNEPEEPIDCIERLTAEECNEEGYDG